MNADFLIIGGGIAGISSAAALAAHGSVVLVEQESHLVYHSTARSAAIFIDSYGNSVVQHLSRFSRPLLAANAPGADGTLLTPRGAVHLIPAGMDFSDAGEKCAALPRMTPADVRTLIPIIKEEAIRGGIHEASCADIDVHALHTAYKRQVRAHDGVILTDAKVERADRSGGVWSVKAGARIISAPVVINAAGAWAGAAGAIFGATDPGLRPTKRSAALVRAPAGQDIASWPVAGTITETVYFKPEAGKLMISPYDEIPCEPHDVYADDQDLAAGIDRFEQLVDWSIHRIDSSWAGLRTLTVDGRPIVGPDPVIPGLFWLAGQGGFGIQTAPATAALIAAQVLGHAIPSELATIVDAVAPGRVLAARHT